MQIDQLLELPPLERVIRDRLGKLPKDLEKAYDEIYAEIQTQEKGVREIADRAFQWVMCSCTPLSTAQLIAAVCQDPETDTVNSVDDMDMDIILSACHNLLVVDPQLKVCRFSHLSVQEYFESRLWRQSEANGTVAKVCLSLLNDLIRHDRSRQSRHDEGVGEEEEEKEEEEEEEEDEEDITGIVRYAMFHWQTHVQRYREENIDTSLAALLKQFLGSTNESGPAYRNWHRMTTEYLWRNRHRNTIPIPLQAKYEQLIPSSMASFALCSFGFHEILSDWWESGCINTEDKNRKGETLLQLAAAGGFVSITEELLKRGADVNAQSEDYGSALMAASAEGHDAIVKLLLKAQADVNAQGGCYGGALVAASHSGHDTSVKLLLEAGADVNMQGGHYGSALQAASLQGNETNMKLLLEAGADVNMQGGHYGSALQAASRWSNDTSVKLLLEAGADVNMQSGYYGSALQAASRQGNDTSVKLLLEAGADVNMQGGTYGSSLQAASYQGDDTTVKLLLEAGADVNMQGGYYGNALRAASRKDNDAAVKLLLKAGAVKSQE